jgi:hypothetical protein
MLQIGPCEYEAELQPLSDAPSLTAESSVPELMAEKQAQSSLLEAFLNKQGRSKKRSRGTKSLATMGGMQVARAAPSAVALAAEAGVRPALQGWQLSGDPTRQQDREPPTPGKARAVKQTRSMSHGTRSKKHRKA